MAMVAADFARLDELVRPFQDRLLGNKSENGAPPVADRVEIARRLERFHSHKTKQFAIASLPDGESGARPNCSERLGGGVGQIRWVWHGKD
jgi:hypothetical protein